ncbi:MAG: hypothetical protein IJK01_03810 [Clostridia bacterium]|jgi:hypothetical protein|nr:hypothetical protein [Clostridia bacterium]
MEPGEWIQFVLLLGSIAGALAGIAALIASAVKAVRRVIRWFTDLGASVDTLLRHDKAQYLSILRLTVMSENIPLSERIAAGKTYAEAGGNGDVKQYYETHLKPFDTIQRKENAHEQSHV